MRRSDGDLSLWKTLRAYARTLAELRPGAASLSYFLLSLILCAIDFGLGAVPASVGLLAACPGAHVTACTLGVLLGSGAFLGLKAALEPCAMAAAVLCARALLPKKRQRVLLPAVAVCACGLVGLSSAAGDHFSVAATARWLSNTAAVAADAGLFRAAQDRRNRAARVGAFCAMLLGLNTLHLAGGWNAAVPVLAWAVSGPAGLTYACAGSAALAAFSPAMAPCAAAFCLGAVVHRLLKARPAELSCAAVCLVYCLAGIRLQSLGFSVCAMAGSIAALLLRPERLLPAQSGVRLPEHPAQRELRQAAKALAQAAEMLTASEPDQDREIAAIFDEAGAQVCRNCAKFRTCWQENGAQLSEDLTRGARGAMARGAAVIEDLPPRFLDRCVHAEAFLTAINDAMDDSRARLQRVRRLRETSTAVQAQYKLMEKLLQRLSERLYIPDAPVNYQPEISVQAAGRGGSAISGDRGAAFAGPEATYYVLLCDGMGTGSDAAAESLRAVGLLRRLLLCGMDAESALKALNGVYILRDNGCFSTVDLLRINLTSGDAILYKWGAAPSYLKRSRGLRLLGGTNLPPGLDRNGHMETIRLSLDHGGVLVLVTDGLGGKEAQKRLDSCGSLIPQDVAASLFAGRAALTDDCTAVAIRLRRAAVREPVPV